MTKEPVWVIGRPRKPEEATVTIKKDIAIVRTASKGVAVVPVSELCRLAERFNLVYKNYKCRQQS